MSMTIGPRVTQPAGMPGAGFADATPGNPSAFFSGKSVQVTAGKTFAGGGVDPAAEGDLRRDDALGKLFKTAFDLPAPAMPEWLTG